MQFITDLEKKINADSELLVHLTVWIRFEGQK